MKKKNIRHLSHISGLTLLTCPICKLQAILMDSAIVYNGTSYGNIWACPNVTRCRCFVGVHKITNKPLGYLADEKTRSYRKKAHTLFDMLWIGKNRRYRGKMYGWLAAMMNVKEAHIGWMNIEQCKTVISLMQDVELSKKKCELK